jgi:hypothetical protein
LPAGPISNRKKIRYLAFAEQEEANACMFPFVDERFDLSMKPFKPLGREAELYAGSAG